MPSFRRTTWAPETVCPEGSVTVPLIAPVEVACPNNCVAKLARSIALPNVIRCIVATPLGPLRPSGGSGVCPQASLFPTRRLRDLCLRQDQRILCGLLDRSACRADHEREVDGKRGTG